MNIVTSTELTKAEKEAEVQAFMARQPETVQVRDPCGNFFPGGIQVVPKGDGREICTDGGERAGQGSLLTP